MLMIAIWGVAGLAPLSSTFSGCADPSYANASLLLFVYFATSVCRDRPFRIPSGRNRPMPMRMRP